MWVVSEREESLILGFLAVIASWIIGATYLRFRKLGAAGCVGKSGVLLDMLNLRWLRNPK